MKKIVFCLGLFALLALVTSSAYAYNENSGFHSSPEAYAGKTTSGSTYSLASASAPVKGSETAVYFSSLGYLRSGVCVSSDSRELNITLMEADTANDDDEIKLYRGTFSGLTLKTIAYRDYATSSSSGNIESSTDDTAELYIKMKLDFVTGDASTTNGTMFNYDIRVS